LKHQQRTRNAYSKHLPKQTLPALLITADELLAHEITVFKDRVRIDVQTSTPGIEFESTWQNRITMSYQGQEFYVASKQDLISSKQASGREKDLEDIRLLKLGGGEDEA
jgi:hypothetical protein